MSYLPPGGRFVEGGREYRLECPACGKDKFHWNIIRGFGSCFACRLGAGSITKFRELFGAFSTDITPPSPTLATRTTSNQETLEAYEDKQCLLYLAGRGVDAKTAAAASISFCPDTQRIIAPIWSPFNHPKTTISRSIAPFQRGWMVGGGRGVTSGLFLFGLPPGGPSITLVEGVFDVLSPGLLGYALALLGSSLVTDLQIWLTQRYRRINLWLDPDTKQSGKRQKMLAQLRAYGTEVVEIDDVEPGAEEEPDRSWARYRADYLKLEASRS